MNFSLESKMLKKNNNKFSPKEKVFLKNQKNFELRTTKLY